MSDYTYKDLMDGFQVVLDYLNDSNRRDNEPEYDFAQIIHFVVTGEYLLLEHHKKRVGRDE